MTKKFICTKCPKWVRGLACAAWKDYRDCEKMVKRDLEIAEKLRKKLNKI